MQEQRTSPMDAPIKKIPLEDRGHLSRTQLYIVAAILSIAVLGLVGYITWKYFQTDNLTTQSSTTTTETEDDENATETSDTIAETSDKEEICAEVEPKMVTQTLSELKIKISYPEDWIFRDNTTNSMGTPEIYEIKTDDELAAGGIRIYFHKEYNTLWQTTANDYADPSDRSIWKIGDEYIWGYYSFIDGIELGDITCEQANMCESGILSQILIKPTAGYLIDIQFTTPMTFVENTENLVDGRTPPYDLLAEVSRILESIEPI